MSKELIGVALAGFLASMVDGSLGMGFGPTSSSIMLSMGIAPGAVSASINVAKVATGVAAGLSHWRLGNIDKRLVARLAIPGSIGALIGTTVLANVDGNELRPYLAILLTLVGVRILVRFSSPIHTATEPADSAAAAMIDVNTRGTELAGMAGGVTNGLVGAWGPVVTPFLLHRGVAPRYAIGCVNTAEVAVAVVSAGSLISTMGRDGLRFDVIGAMLLGGVVASPLAAYAVRLFRPRLLGLAVAGLLLITQARELAGTTDLPGSRWIAYLTIPLAVSFAAVKPPLERWHRQRRQARTDNAASSASPSETHCH